MKTEKGVEVPADLARALRADPTVRSVFERMRPSCQQTYVKWVEEAKRPETRARRIGKVPERVLDYGRRHDMLTERPARGTGPASARRRRPTSTP